MSSSERVEWLIPHWLPQHRATLLATHPGTAWEAVLMRVAVAVAFYNHRDYWKKLRSAPADWPVVAPRPDSRPRKVIYAFDNTPTGMHHLFEDTVTGPPSKRQQRQKPLVPTDDLYELHDGLWAYDLRRPGDEGRVPLWGEDGQMTARGYYLKKKLLYGFDCGPRVIFPDLFILAVSIQDLYAVEYMSLPQQQRRSLAHWDHFFCEPLGQTVVVVSVEPNLTPKPGSPPPEKNMIQVMAQGVNISSWRLLQPGRTMRLDLYSSAARRGRSQEAPVPFYLDAEGRLALGIAPPLKPGQGGPTHVQE